MAKKKKKPVIDQKKLPVTVDIEDVFKSPFRTVKCPHCNGTGKTLINEEDETRYAR